MILRMEDIIPVYIESETFLWQELLKYIWHLLAGLLFVLSLKSIMVTRSSQYWTSPHWEDKKR